MKKVFLIEIALMCLMTGCFIPVPVAHVPRSSGYDPRFPNRGHYERERHRRGYRYPQDGPLANEVQRR